EIHVTENHYLWVDGVTEKEAKDFQLFDKLYHVVYGQVTITRIIKAQDIEFTYNLTVEKYHNYFAEGILVHNVGGGKTSAGGVSYFATMIMALGEGPLPQVMIIYQDNATYTTSNFPTNGAYWFEGSNAQTAWSVITANWPLDARGYKDTAYYAFLNAQLDGSATVPQFNIVPKGILAGTSPLNNTTLVITTGQYDQNGNSISTIGNIALGDADA